MPGPQVYGRCPFKIRFVGGGVAARGLAALQTTRQVSAHPRGVGDAAPYKAAIPDSIINNLPHLLQVFYLLYVAKAV